MGSSAFCLIRPISSTTLVRSLSRSRMLRSTASMRERNSSSSFRADSRVMVPRFGCIFLRGGSGHGESVLQLAREGLQLDFERRVVRIALDQTDKGAAHDD